MNPSESGYGRFGWYSRPATPAQIRCLEELGIPLDKQLTYLQADRLIKLNHAKWDQLPVTRGQEAWLQRNGLWKEGMKRGEASAIIGRSIPPRNIRDWEGG